jgi:hypothetical protein
LRFVYLGDAAMRRELESVLNEAKILPLEELPALIGALAEITATAQARLASPRIDARPDELLDVEQAAKRLNCSPDYLYRNHKKLSFWRENKVGRKLVFSSAGLDVYLKNHDRRV